MKYQIDQSNKIEQTEKDTAIAVANGKTFVILIPRKIKRILQKIFRRQSKPRQFVYETFAAALVLLLKYAKIEKNAYIAVDKEYFGKEKLVQFLFNQMRDKQTPDINFALIGKKSPAHSACYLATHGKRQQDKIISLEEILKTIFP